MSTPCVKVAYHSRDAATRARKASRGKNARFRMKHRLSPYKCPHCGLWHLTSLEKT